MTVEALALAAMLVVLVAAKLVLLAADYAPKLARRPVPKQPQGHGAVLARMN